MTELKCPMCGRSFIPKHKRQIFCCTSCAAKYHRDKRKPNKPPKNCVICGKEFIPWNKNQVTCGSKECSRQNELIWKKKKRGTYNPEKNEGLTKKIQPREGYTPADRWKRMSWKEISAECARLHLTYGRAQVMAQNGTLPEDWGLHNDK